MTTCFTSGLDRLCLMLSSVSLGCLRPVRCHHVRASPQQRFLRPVAGEDDTCGTMCVSHVETSQTDVPYSQHYSDLSAVFKDPTDLKSCDQHFLHYAMQLRSEGENLPG